MTCSLVNCSSAHSPHARSPLFVVTAHVPDDRNFQVLVRTLRHLRCHHPNNFVLVVDNASPHKEVVRRAVAVVAHPSTNKTRIIRRDHSMGILTSWAAADEVLDDWRSYGVPPDWKYVVFLQHTTVPCRPIPTNRLQCDATALAGTIALSGFKVRIYTSVCDKSPRYLQTPRCSQKHFYQGATLWREARVGVAARRGRRRSVRAAVQTPRPGVRLDAPRRQAALCRVELRLPLGGCVLARGVGTARVVSAMGAATSSSVGALAAGEVVPCGCNALVARRRGRSQRDDDRPARRNRTAHRHLALRPEPSSRPPVAGVCLPRGRAPAQDTRSHALLKQPFFFFRHQQKQSP